MGIRISVRVKLPPGFDVNKFTQAIVRAQKEKTAPALRRYFESTVEGWAHPPYWSERQYIGSDKISIKVFAGGENAKIYALVSRGARAHPIVAHHGRLRFQPGYIAATRPGSLSSRSRQRFGNYITPRVVAHPGFEPRDFDRLVGEAYAPQFGKDMQDALKVY